MASKKIILQGHAIIDERFPASEAITPGHLIELSGGQWRKHTGSATNAPPIFALEREELGLDIDTAYAIGDYVKAGRMSKPSKVNALIASGQNITANDYVESAGNGTLKKVATDAATDDTQRLSLVGQADETSGAVTVLTRLKVWIA